MKKLIALVMVCLAHNLHSAEIVGLTKDCLHGSFVIGNKSFTITDIVSLEQKDQESLIQAARPNRLVSCLTGTNNQLFLDKKLSCIFAPICGADLNSLRDLPPHIKKDLIVQSVNDDAYFYYEWMVMPGSLTGSCIVPCSTGCTLPAVGMACCFAITPAAIVCLAQRVKQWFWSKPYSVDKEMYLKK